MQQAASVLAAAMDLKQEQLFVASCADSDMSKPRITSQAAHMVIAADLAAHQGGGGFSMNGGRYNA